MWFATSVRFLGPHVSPVPCVQPNSIVNKPSMLGHSILVLAVQADATGVSIV